MSKRIDDETPLIKLEGAEVEKLLVKVKLAKEAPKVPRRLKLLVATIEKAKQTKPTGEKCKKKKK